MSAQTTSSRDVDRTGTLTGRVLGMFGTQMLVAAVGIINGIVVARLLGPAGKGDYFLLVLLPSTMMILLQLGLPQAFTFYAAQGRTRGLIGKSFLLAAGLSAIGFAIAYLLLPLLQNGILDGISLDLVVVALLALPFMLHAPFSAGVVMGRQAVRWYSSVALAQPLVTTVLVVIVVGALSQGVAGAIAVFTTVVATNAVLFSVAAVRVARTVPEPKAAPIRQLVGYGLRFYPGSLSGFFSYRIDAFLIAILIAEASEPLGYYSMSVALAEVIFLFPKAVNAIFFPHVAGSSRADSDRQVALVSRVTLLVSGASAIILIPCAAIMIWAVLPAFVSSLPPFVVLLPGVVALSAANVVGGYVTGIGRPGVNSGVSVLALAVNVGANLVLIPQFGIMGAAVASLVSYTLSAIALTAVAARLSGSSIWRFWVPGREDVRFIAATSAALARRVLPRVRSRQG